MATLNPIPLPISRPANAHVLAPAVVEYSGGNNLIRDVGAVFLTSGDGRIEGGKILPNTYDASATDPKFRLLFGCLDAGAAGEEVVLEAEFHTQAPNNQDADPASLTTKQEIVDVSSWVVGNTYLVEIAPANPVDMEAGGYLKFAIERVKSHGQDDYPHDLALLKAWVYVPY